MNKIKLSRKQMDRLSEIYGNISVALFSAGVVAQFFIRPIILFDLVIQVVLSLLLSAVFLYLSLKAIKGSK